MEKIIVKPKSVRCLGNIVSPKSIGSFLGDNIKVTSSTDSAYGTVFTGEYLSGSYIQLEYDKCISSEDTSFTVSATLKKNIDNSAITSTPVYFNVNGNVTYANTNGNGVASITIPVDGSSEYNLNVYWPGDSSVAAGCKVTAKIAVVDSYSLDFFTDKSILQTDDTSYLVARVTGTSPTGDVVGVPGQTVLFYEEYLPGIRFFADKNIMQSGDNCDLSAQLIDAEDGSLVRKSGVGVKFYQQNVTSLTDPLTSDNHLFGVSNATGELTYSSDGMKFQQLLGHGASLAYVPVILDVVNHVYEISFDVMNWSTSFNTPFRCVARTVDDFTDLGYLPLLDTIRGWNINDVWERGTSHTISSGDTIKIYFEDGNYKVYKNDIEVAASDWVIGESIFSGFIHSADEYVTLKNFKFKEVE